MKIIKWYFFILGTTSFSIPNICCISKNHLEKIRKNECFSAQNIVTENNNAIFASWLNPSIGTTGNRWSSIIQKNPYLHRSNIDFRSALDGAPDIRVGGGLYANNDYYRPQYSKEDGIGIFKYYNFSQIKNLHANKLDLTPDFTSNHGSISKSNTKLFFTHLLNNLLNDWYWKTFQDGLRSEHIPHFANTLSLVNQDWDFWAKNCNDLIQLEFGVEYNELQKIHILIDKWNSIFIGALASAVFSFIPVSGIRGALASFITSAIISYAMPEIFDRVSFKNIHQVHRFISKPLTMTFWNHLFASLFGAPGHHKGVLLDFISRYGELPSQLHLDNFDFYLPLDSFIMREHQLDFHNAGLQLSLHTTAMRPGVDLLNLKNQITDWLNNWFDYFDFYIKEHKYADEDSCFISDVVCYQLGQDIPGLTFNFYKYFSLSHTELFVGKKVPVTLYFNEDNKYADLGIAWVTTIYVKGYDQI